jgi:hypothetical protein
MKWNENFKLLAARLCEPDLQVLWMDLHALQLIFYKHESPVYLAPVYGTVTRAPGGVMSAYPHVPILPALMALEGPTIFDDNDLPDDFTVVPILASSPTNFVSYPTRFLKTTMKFYVRTSRVTIHTSQRQLRRLVYFGIYQS